MSRPKMGSRILQTADRRLASLKSIDDKLNLGNNLTLTRYEQNIDGLHNKIERYNKLLAELDGLRSEIKVDESTLGQLSEQMLMGVACTYGKDSYEYKQAGGVRRSERKRPAREVTPAPA